MGGARDSSVYRLFVTVYVISTALTLPSQAEGGQVPWSHSIVAWVPWRIYKVGLIIFCCGSSVTWYLWASSFQICDCVQPDPQHLQSLGTLIEVIRNCPNKIPRRRLRPQRRLHQLHGWSNLEKTRLQGPGPVATTHPPPRFCPHLRGLPSALSLIFAFRQCSLLDATPCFGIGVDSFGVYRSLSTNAAWVGHRSYSKMRLIPATITRPGSLHRWRCSSQRRSCFCNTPWRRLYRSSCGMSLKWADGLVRGGGFWGCGAWGWWRLCCCHLEWIWELRKFRYSLVVPFLVCGCPSEKKR